MRRAIGILKMNKNDIVELKITDITADGSGVGKYESMAVFVPNTAIGDTVRARILKVKKSYAFGKIEEILFASGDRIEADCSCFERCGGCMLRHISYESEAALKENRVCETMKRIGGVDLMPAPIISAEKQDRYRNKAQYPVSVDSRVGFYATHSHRIVCCDDCKLLPKEFVAISDVFCDWIRENSVRVYDEQTGKGLVRHLYLRKGQISGEIMVVVVINGDKLQNAPQLAERLLAVNKNIKSIQININKKATNVVLGDKYTVIYGEDHITDTICGVRVRLSPASFYQVNHEMAQKLYQKAKEYAVPQGKNILDLYCGTGTIGLSMADSAKSVIGVEIVPSAIADAKQNARDNGFDNARFICADAATAAKDLKKENIKTDVVILDPPRKGCEESLLEIVAQDFCPQRIVYVSCDVATLARDTKILTALGYTLKEYTPVDLFPRTPHIETVACFCK